MPTDAFAVGERMRQKGTQVSRSDLRQFRITILGPGPCTMRLVAILGPDNDASLRRDCSVEIMGQSFTADDVTALGTLEGLPEALRSSLRARQEAEPSGEIPIPLAEERHHDGSSTMRTSVASIRTAVANATPSCLKSTSLSVAKMANTATITRAALEMTPAVVVIPSARLPPRSTRSRSGRASGGHGRSRS